MEFDSPPCFMRCDNTDHEGETEDLKPVKMTEEFDEEWCKGCRERDREMIKERV